MLLSGAGLVPIVLVALPSGGRAQPLSAEVVSIGDGDTLRVRQEGQLLTVRLACVDAPETAQSPWGLQARRSLQRHLPLGQSVTLEVKARDRYGRTVAEVIGDSNIGLAMVEAGAVFVYRQYLAGCDAMAYQEAEQRARRHRLGVWQQPGGLQRPWDFRRSRRASQAPG